MFGFTFVVGLLNRELLNCLLYQLINNLGNPVEAEDSHAQVENNRFETLPLGNGYFSGVQSEFLALYDKQHDTCDYKTKQAECVAEEEY